VICEHDGPPLDHHRLNKVSHAAAPGPASCRCHRDRLGPLGGAGLGRRRVEPQPLQNRAAAGLSWPHWGHFMDRGSTRGPSLALPPADPGRAALGASNSWLGSGDRSPSSVLSAALTSGGASLCLTARSKASLKILPRSFVAVWPGRPGRFGTSPRRSHSSNRYNYWVRAR
jgi:hypothetical protein